VNRRVHAQFRVFRLNRWSAALVLLAALALLLFPWNSSLPVSGLAAPRVHQGVILLDRDFSGKTEPEARAMLTEMAQLYEGRPIAARQGELREGVSYVIPELNGYALDVDRTWFRLAVASEGSRVEPAANMTSPGKRLSDYPQSVIYRGNDEKQAVGLLINVDWGTKELIQMLPVFKERGVKATFFVSGSWADKNERLLARMAEEGHEIATHGHRLSSGPRALAKAGRLKGDVQRSVETIEAITKMKVRYYAPHMSEVDTQIVQTASDLGLRTVLYSVDTVDWRDSTTGPMILTKFGKLRAGDLILMHPKPNTAQVLKEALIGLQGRGLRPLVLSELLNPEPDSPHQTGKGPHE
jgi:hypothetical protein